MRSAHRRFRNRVTTSARMIVAFTFRWQKNAGKTRPSAKCDAAKGPRIPGFAEICWFRTTLSRERRFSNSEEHPGLNAVEIIARKRDGHELTQAEIGWFIDRFATGELPDYQMSAWAMAVFLQGMSREEVTTLTAEMLGSGIRLEHVDDGRPCVDKHSTGGIGDKTSLVLAPLLACFDLRVPMLSGRGLGPTGGTLDKLEAIPGFRTDLSVQELQGVVQSVGCVITGASSELAPADRKLYALRDVTGTVPCVPLITASIMSKKLAESPDALVLDVKFGSGAFMQSYDQARVLAQSLCRTGAGMDLATTAIMTDMNQPLGRMCGNANEVIECLEFLRGEAVPDDLTEVTYQLAAELLLATGKCGDRETAMAQLREAITSGRAMELFERMVSAQNGSTAFEFELARTSEFAAPAAGYVSSIDTRELGFAIIELGGGRKTKTDKIDHSVGIEMLARIGDKVEADQPLVRIFSSDAERIHERLEAAITIADESPASLPLIAETITAETP